ncbi:MAG TPA: hypothetical protein VFB58_04610 [Chloroflexota bacterium]|nr:hypothetical protein [Chloroflexota bacterium]
MALSSSPMDGMVLADGLRGGAAQDVAAQAARTVTTAAIEGSTADVAGSAPLPA